MSSESTLKPAEVAQVMVDYAVAKHRDRYESVFWKAVSAFRAFSLICHLRRVFSLQQVLCYPLEASCRKLYRAELWA